MKDWKMRKDGYSQREKKKMTEVDNIIKNNKGKGLNVQNKTFIGKMNKK